MLNILAVFLGGGIGATCRYLVNLASAKITGTAVWSTLGVNIIGCFLIGYVLGVVINKSDSIPAVLKTFITVGFLGGLTTFSTFSNEAFCMLKDGRLLYCILYVLFSIILGLGVTALGYFFAK